MLDTIVLTIDLGGEAEKQKIISPATFDNWSPSLSGVLSKPYHRLGSKGQIHCYLNPSAINLRSGKYYPTLEFYKKHTGDGIFKNVLYIRFSITKLLFDNNLEELADITPFENDLNDAANWLHIRLLEMGVNVSVQQILKCPCNQAHFSKNIMFNDGTIPYSIISYLSKSNIDLRRRITNDSYAGGGYGSHIATNKKGLSIYDKVKEMQKTRQITKTFSDGCGGWYQFDIFGDLLPSSTQVLRLEMQCGSPRMIRETLINAGIRIGSEITLTNIYGSRIAKHVLLNELAKLEDKIPPIANNHESISDFTEALLALNPKSTASQRMKVIAVKSLLNSNSMRDIRTMLQMTSSQWSRLMADVSKLNVNTDNYNPLAEVRKQLEKFQPIRLHKPP